MTADHREPEHRSVSTLKLIAAIVGASAAVLASITVFIEKLPTFDAAICASFGYRCPQSAAAASAPPQLNSEAPRKFVFPIGSFERDGNGPGWSESGHAQFKFIEAAVDDKYIYLVDTSRFFENVDRGRPFTLRVPLRGGMSQWSYPPGRWLDLYPVTPKY